MATWIVHLRLAELLLQRLPGLDPADFAIGNVAPDSGVPDEKWEHFDPPPAVTHFHARDNMQYKDLADLDFYRRYMVGSDPARFSFLLGYFFHLVTDNLWSLQIGRPTFARFAAEFAADRNFIWTVKKDWYGLDLLYVRDHPDSLFWRVFLDCHYDGADLDFMPPGAIRRNLDHIKEYYQREDRINEAAARPYIYLSQAEMDSFIARAADRLERAYRQLFVERVDSAGKRSVLELGD